MEHVTQGLLGLSFTFARDEFLKTPWLFTKAMNDPAVSAAIRKELDDHAKTILARNQPTYNDFAATLRNAAGIVGKDMLRQVSTDFKQSEVADALQHYADAFNQSPTGIWVDRNQSLILVVGAFLAISGTAAMYRFRSGDAIVSPALKLLGHRVVHLGTIDAGFEKIVFTPSKRYIATHLFVEHKTEKMDLHFDLDLQLLNGQVQVPTAGIRLDYSPLKNTSLGNTSIGHTTLSVSVEVSERRQAIMFRFTVPFGS